MIMLNHENPREVVLGRELPPLHSKRFVIEIWSRQRDGTWRKKHDVSRLDPEQPSKVFKAYIPWNHHPEFKVLWLGGPYTGITTWETRMYRTVGAFPE
ncbi:MAG: hypothetical protein RBS80_15435 [Thermoguttaceae bacterium]|jgi:hypothetical protein|nr:hypothetical protein [Thermoguttaceae bacterium]